MTESRRDSIVNCAYLWLVQLNKYNREAINDTLEHSDNHD